MTDLFLFGTYTYNIMILYLLRSYTHGGLILIPISHRTQIYSDSLYTVLNLYIYLDEGTYHILILLSISDLPSGVYRTYAYTIGFILILRSLHLFRGTRRYYRDITERILVLRNLSLYESTRKYYKTYTGTSYLILVLRSISWSYGTYTCITELIHVFHILYLSYRTYTCITDLILVLQNLFLSYGSYTCVTELILEFQILFLYEGTRRYDKSEHIRIISHTRSDQTYTDADISHS